MATPVRYPTLGQPVEQCVKDDGLCECSQLAISKSAKTSCAVTNEFGACTAERQCLEDGSTACNADPASAEICDGIDNDCNADTLDGRVTRIMAQRVMAMTLTLRGRNVSVSRGS